MRVLKVKEPFASMIVKGEKVWELRRRHTFIRERIGIGVNGKVIGYVDLYDSWFAIMRILKQYDKFHHADQFIDSYAKGKKGLFVWQLTNPEVEPLPYPYSFSTGSWCKAERPCYLCNPCLHQNQNDCRVIHSQTNNTEETRRR